MENYHRRWNLILHGLEEKDQQDIRQETIRVLQGILHEAKDKIPGAVDTIHRLLKAEELKKTTCVPK